MIIRRHPLTQSRLAKQIRHIISRQQHLPHKHHHPALVIHLPANLFRGNRLKQQPHAPARPAIQTPRPHADTIKKTLVNLGIKIAPRQLHQSNIGTLAIPCVSLLHILLRYISGPRDPLEPRLMARHNMAHMRSGQPGTGHPGRPIPHPAHKIGRTKP